MQQQDLMSVEKKNGWRGDFESGGSAAYRIQTVRPSVCVLSGTVFVLTDEDELYITETAPMFPFGGYT